MLRIKFLPVDFWVTKTANQKGTASDVCLVELSSLAVCCHTG